jgi:acetyl esterase/lipase
MKFSLATVLVSATVALAGCGLLLNPQGAPAAVDTVVYTPTDWPQELQAEVYQPKGDGPFPGMLLVHGGGWEGRHREDMDRLARYYTDQGYVVMNISYRFAPAAIYPAQVHDLQQAMHWLHREAGRLQLDRDRIVAFGYSAGAHLVSLMALAAGTGEALDQPWGGIETRPAAVIAGGAPMDLRKYTDGELVPQFLGGSIEEIPETFVAASPVTLVHDNAPPFFLFHGSRDKLVTIDHAEDFVVALEARDVPVELVPQAARGHILTFLTVGTALPDADRFLTRHLTPAAGTSPAF